MLWGPLSRSGVVVLVDGPNVLREEFDVDLDDVRDIAKGRGNILTMRCYLSEYATSELIQAAEARGFDVRITSGDVDVKLAVDGTKLICDARVDTFIVVSRDADFKPLVELANANGITSVVMIPGERGRSDALSNAASETITLES
ncbi:MAG: NYN domain-containing protein [Halobacteriaceae archaeon]